MSGRRRQTLSPSLFPFLAVLVCTLGTLILLLALVARNSTQAAQQRVEQQAPPSDVDAFGRKKLTVDQVEELIDDEQFRIDALVSVRDEQTADLEQRRDQLAHLEDHTRRLREQLKTLSEQVAAATDSNQETSVDENEVLRLEAELKLAEQELEKEKNEKGGQQPRVVIVPHKGPNGTDRRPIYVECTARGVTIWPEGVSIELENLEYATRNANPLESALRVARLRALQDYGDAIAPYPMLICRPEGVMSYAAARRAMKDWDDQFGYELVPSELELAYAQPDSELKRRMEYAIRQAVIQQNGLVAMAQRAFGSGRGGGLSRTGRNSEFGRRGTGGGSELAGGSRKPLPSLSAAAMDRQGRSSGFRDHRVPVGSRFANNYGNVGGSRPGFYAGTGADAVAQLDQRLQEASDAASGSADSGLGSPGTGLAGTAVEPGQHVPRQGRTAIEQIGQDGSVAQPSDPFAGEGFDFQRNPYMSGQTSTGSPGSSPRVASTQQSPALSPGTNLATGSGQPSRHMPASGLPDRGQSFQGMESTDPSANDSMGAGQFSLRPAANGGHSSASTQSQSAMQGAASPANRSASSGAQGGPMSSSSSMQQPSHQNATPSISASATATQSVSEMVRRGGANWALPQELALARGNEVIRTIKVQCYHDRFILVPSKRDGDAVRTYSFSDGEINRASLQLATAVRDRIKTWGAALPGGRWQPRLEVEVMPHADQRFHQLRTLLRGSGVDVERGNP